MKTILIPFVAGLLLCIMLVSVSSVFERAFVALFLAEGLFARDFSTQLVDKEHAQGAAFPYRDRLPFLPVAAGMLAYVAIGLDGVATAAVPAVGAVAAAAIAAGKLWLSKGPLWPYPSSSDRRASDS